MGITELFVQTKEGIVRVTFRPSLTRIQRADFFDYLVDVETREEVAIVAFGAADEWDRRVSAVIMLLACELN